MTMRSIFASLALLGAAASAQGQSTPTAVIDRAIDRMGGAATLQKIERARFEQMTLWHRQTFEDRPYGDVVGSFERVTDLRDYTLPAWRNTRRFIGPVLASPEIVDVVRDTVAIRLSPPAPNATAAWNPLNIAYLDERRELFAFAPERLLLAARSAKDLRALPDTAIDGVAHARVHATVEGFPATITLRRTDGFPAFVRYVAAQPNDFGLAPYGAMEVEVWYGQWRSLANAGAPVRYPMQLDVSRIGRPYKRITILSARFDVAASPDSFAVSDELRGKYMATATKAMWDMPLDSGRVIDGRFAVLGPPGFSPPAVKVGRSWILLEGTSVPERAEAMQGWLATRDAGTKLGGMLVTIPGAIRGEASWFARQGRPVYLGRGAQRGAQVVLKNWKVPATAVTLVSRGRWTTFEGDSMWVEPFDAPGVNGGVVAWVPSLRWVYQGMSVDPAVREQVLDLAKQRGWSVERIGNVRAVTAPLSTASR